MSILFYFLAFYKQINWLIKKIIDMLINNENNHQFQLVLGDKKCRYVPAPDASSIAIRELFTIQDITNMQVITVRGEKTTKSVHNCVSTFVSVKLLDVLNEGPQCFLNF